MTPENFGQCPPFSKGHGVKSAKLTCEQRSTTEARVDFAGHLRKRGRTPRPGKRKESTGHWAMGASFEVESHGSQVKSSDRCFISEKEKAQETNNRAVLLQDTGFRRFPPVFVGYLTVLASCPPFLPSTPTVNRQALISACLNHGDPFRMVPRTITHPHGAADLTLAGLNVPNTHPSLYPASGLRRNPSWGSG